MANNVHPCQLWQNVQLYCGYRVVLSHKAVSQVFEHKVQTKMFQYYLDVKIKSKYSAMTVSLLMIILLYSRFEEKIWNSLLIPLPASLPCGQQTNLSHEGHQFIVQDWKGLQPLFDWNETLRCCRNEMPVKTQKKILFKQNTNYSFNTNNEKNLTAILQNIYLLFEQSVHVSVVIHINLLLLNVIYCQFEKYSKKITLFLMCNLLLRRTITTNNRLAVWLGDTCRQSYKIYFMSNIHL